MTNRARDGRSAEDFAPTSSMRRWIEGFVPAPVAVGWRERLRACIGALLGIVITGLMTRWMLDAPSSLFLVAPMGASAVLLFALPASPLAQPWSIVGGNLVSAAVGVTCAAWIGEPMLAAAIAVALAIAAMFALRCLHPPSGAVALTAVLGGPAIHALGYHFLVAPIAINSLLLLAVALLFNNLTRHRYPHPARMAPDKPGAAAALPNRRPGFTSADLDAALKNYDQVLDINRDDLEALLRQTEMQAWRRRMGAVTCADIMSRQPVAVEFGTSLQEAWQLLQTQQTGALPVIDRARRVIGLVTLSDFVFHAGFDGSAGFGATLRRFLRPAPQTHSEKAEVAGQIMRKPVPTVSASTHIVELVPALGGASLHHVPVVDAERRLVGMIAASDLAAGLYQVRLEEGVRDI